MTETDILLVEKCDSKFSLDCGLKLWHNYNILPNSLGIKQATKLPVSEYKACRENEIQMVTLYSSANLLILFETIKCERDYKYRNAAPLLLIHSVIGKL
jgi:hypothetical protein